MADHAARRMHRLTGTAGAALLAFALLIAPSAAEAGKGDGGAGYEYKVSQFDYNAFGELAATRSQEECVAGETASWIGRVDTFPGELAQLNKYGEGGLDIRQGGTDGEFKARTELESNFGGTGGPGNDSAEHRQVTSCGGESSEYQETQTLCKDGPVETEISVKAFISGKVGKQLKIEWIFRQVDVDGLWLPDIFRCVQLFAPFPVATCKSAAKLNAFTKRKFTLGFACAAEDNTRPPGFDGYRATVNINGFVELKRTKQD